MKSLYRSIVTAASMAALLMMTACDWESGSQDNFNTSGGSANINVSGFYRGNLSGGRVVGNTSNGNIISLTIQQSGNRVQVTDNQGSTYSGTLGAPLTIDTNDTIVAGESAATFQISFSGKDGVSARDINFTGILTVVAVTDVVGNTSTNGNTNGNTSTTTTTTNSVVEPIAPDDEGSGITTNTTDSSTSTSTRNTTSTTNYSLSRNNNQLELNGTWVEVGGVSSTVSALGPPAQGNITVGF